MEKMFGLKDILILTLKILSHERQGKRNQEKYISNNHLSSLKNDITETKVRIARIKQHIFYK